MKHDSTSTLDRVIEIDERKLEDHLGCMVRGTVEDTLNTMLEAEADALCGATRYQMSPARRDPRAGEVTLKVPTLCTLPLERAIIERYRRREASVEEALIEMYLASVSVRRVEDVTGAL